MELICKNCKKIKIHYALNFCKSCYMKNYFKKNQKKISQYKKEWARKNPECQKKYRQKNKKRISQILKKNYHNNIDGKTHIKIHWDGSLYIRCRGGKFLHRVLAEKALGRRLKPNEVVHHIDENTLNNENSNLLICTRSFHKWLHHNKYNGINS